MGVEAAACECERPFHCRCVCVIVCCSVVQCVAVNCGVCCSVSARSITGVCVLQCVAVRCSESTPLTANVNVCT